MEEKFVKNGGMENNAKTRDLLPVLSKSGLSADARGLGQPQETTVWLPGRTSDLGLRRTPALQTLVVAWGLGGEGIGGNRVDGNPLPGINRRSGDTFPPAFFGNLINAF